MRGDFWWAVILDPALCPWPGDLGLGEQSQAVVCNSSLSELVPRRGDGGSSELYMLTLAMYAVYIITYIIGDYAKLYREQWDYIRSRYFKDPIPNQSGFHGISFTGVVVVAQARWLFFGWWPRYYSQMAENSDDFLKQATDCSSHLFYVNLL